MPVLFGVCLPVLCCGEGFLVRILPRPCIWWDGGRDGGTSSLFDVSDPGVRRKVQQTPVACSASRPPGLLGPPGVPVYSYACTSRPGCTVPPGCNEFSKNTVRLYRPVRFTFFLTSTRKKRSDANSFAELLQVFATFKHGRVRGYRIALLCRNISKAQPGDRSNRLIIRHALVYVDPRSCHGDRPSITRRKRVLYSPKSHRP